MSSAKNAPPCEWDCIQSSLSHKASPYKLSPWIDYSLTLDGRDKITKVIQYLAKFLAFYYDCLHSYYQTWKQQKGRFNTESKAYCQYQATRYRNLQKALSEARKAFGLGRSWIEYHNLKKTGILEWISEYVTYWKNQSLTTYQACTSIPKTLPFKVSFTLRAFRDYLNFPPSIQNQNGQSKYPTPLSWKTIAQSTRFASMVAFYTFDNISFLANAGFLDSLWLTLPLFVPQRHKTAKSSASIGSIASRMANRTFFFQSLLNLFMSWKDWKDHQQGTLKVAWEQYQSVKQQKLLTQRSSTEYKNCTKKSESRGVQEGDKTYSLQPEQSSPSNETDESNLQIEQLKLIWEKVQYHHFTLFLNLLKNSCDVLVFANSSGVDLPMKISGKKMNEGIHSVSGLFSALCVIIQNFPHALNDKEIND